MSTQLILTTATSKVAKIINNPSKKQVETAIARYLVNSASFDQDKICYAFVARNTNIKFNDVFDGLNASSDEVIKTIDSSEAQYKAERDEFLSAIA